MVDAIEDVSLVWLVALTIGVTVVAYLLLTTLQGVSEWVLWGIMMVLIALVAAAAVVLGDPRRGE